MLLSASTASAEVPYPGSPQYANKVLGNFITPTIEPGEMALLEFDITNPYPSDVMVNVALRIGVYEYATQDGSDTVDEDFPHPPLIERNSTEATAYIESILNYSNEDDDRHIWNASVPIYTSEDTPHGSYFSQCTYFIRFNMSFSLEGNSSLIVLKSRGWFTDEQWDTMVSWESEDPIVNITYMNSLGVDGLLPDTSFGIKVPIPRWPLGVIIVAAAGFSGLGLYYYVLDNPGKHPRLEKRFYNLRGKLSELRSQTKYRRGK